MPERIREEIDLFVADLKKEDEKISWETVRPGARRSSLT